MNTRLLGLLAGTAALALATTAASAADLPSRRAAPLPAIAAVAATLGVYEVALAGSEVSVTVLGSPRYFTPNGDGQDDTADLRYCVDVPALMLARVGSRGRES